MAHRSTPSGGSSANKRDRNDLGGYDSMRGYPDVQRRRDKRIRHNDKNDYYGPTGSERTHGDYDRGRPDRDWKCLECQSRNYAQEDRCSRCGAWYEPRQRDHGKKSDFGRALEQLHKDADEFGRRSQMKQAHPPPPPKSMEWPSIFQECGAAYVFDARSGFFYESASDFFYDPKTKLYYGNKKKRYFSHCAGQDPPFQEVANQQTTEEVPKAVEKPSEKKMIAISLKTKKLPKSKASKETANVTAVAKVSKEPAETLVQKKHAAHIDMWSERGKEMRSEQAAAVPKTTKGQPICVLCKRKFASIDKLRQHEEKSALHKENLEKKKAADAKAAADKAAYRDRAKERRFMYGPETSAQAPVIVADEQARQAQVVKPEESLGETNIGNQMLQKLGWKSGKSLGRQQASTEQSRESVQQNIRSDWEKIESMAESSSSSGKRQGGLGS